MKTIEQNIAEMAKMYTHITSYANVFLSSAGNCRRKKKSKSAFACVPGVLSRNFKFSLLQSLTLCAVQQLAIDLVI